MMIDEVLEMAAVKKLSLVQFIWSEKEYAGGIGRTDGDGWEWTQDTPVFDYYRQLFFITRNEEGKLIQEADPTTCEKIVEFYGELTADKSLVAIVEKFFMGEDARDEDWLWEPLMEGIQTIVVMDDYKDGEVETRLEGYVSVDDLKKHKDLFPSSCSFKVGNITIDPPESMTR
jgi:hypothetical protein